MAAATEKVEAAPQKEKQATAKELVVALPTAQAKANPLKAFGSLFGGATFDPKAAAAPVAKAVSILKPTPLAAPAAKKAANSYGRASSSRGTGAADGSSAPVNGL